MVPTVELPDMTPLTSQTTAVFVVPVTVARKATVWLTTAVGDWGATVTVIAPGLPPPPLCLASDKPLQPEKPAATTSTNKKRVARRIVSPTSASRFQASTQAKSGRAPRNTSVTNSFPVRGDRLTWAFAIDD